MDVASTASTPSTANHGTGPGVAGNGTLELPTGGPDSVVLNEAAVKAIEGRGVGTTTIDLAWNPPRPTPRSYRVELRYLSLDSDDKLRVDWRPYAKADIHPTQSQVTARVSGLPGGTRQYVRVVAVDDEGRLAAPSPVLMFETRVAATWFHITPLKVLIGLLFAVPGFDDLPEVGGTPDFAGTRRQPRGPRRGFDVPAVSSGDRQPGGGSGKQTLPSGV